uniref:Uncharacterized protein n=1 Tax=Setaria viridis TaxID=4556 RepID=A0A4U6SWL3_SETVI|nr:hypothetical protein SEVIR_9G165800v2 [Setaria viridis]
MKHSGSIQVANAYAFDGDGDAAAGCSKAAALCGRPWPSSLKLGDARAIITSGAGVPRACAAAKDRALCRRRTCACCTGGQRRSIRPRRRVGSLLAVRYS